MCVALLYALFHIAMSCSLKSLRLNSSVGNVLLHRGNVILYDGLCNFCTGCVSLVRKYDTHNKFTTTPLQSAEGKELMKSIGRDSNDLASVVYVRTKLNDLEQVENQEVFLKSDAALRVVEELLGLPPVVVSIVSTVIPRVVRDGMYDFIASRRYRIMGKKEDCGCGSPPVVK